MAYKWGTKNLRVIKDSYTPPFAEVAMEEVILLPGRDGSRNTVLQQGFTGRERAELTITVYSNSEYRAFVNDYRLKVKKTFTGADGYTNNMIIETMDSVERRLHPLRFTFTLGLVEA